MFVLVLGWQSSMSADPEFALSSPTVSTIAGTGYTVQSLSTQHRSSLEAQRPAAGEHGTAGSAREQGRARSFPYIAALRRV